MGELSQTNTTPLSAFPQSDGLTARSVYYCPDCGLVRKVDLHRPPSEASVESRILDLSGQCCLLLAFAKLIPLRGLPGVRPTLNRA
jgi:hypothetical protein